MLDQVMLINLPGPTHWPNLRHRPEYILDTEGGGGQMPPLRVPIFVVLGLRKPITPSE